MKLLTLNTHSIIEDNYNEKLIIFTDAVSRLKPDIIALQEVNQTADATPIDNKYLDGNININSGISIKNDNHAAIVNYILRSKGIRYNWCWIPIKNGYDKFDEGIAIYSLSPITDTKVINLTESCYYSDWRTRKALGIKTISGQWFYSVHFGWWEDSLEPFPRQWERFLDATNDKIWALGDFNSPSDIKGEGYDLVINSGWYDTYTLASKRDTGITVSGKIAGWNENNSDKRIDYIFTNQRADIKSSEVIFNGNNEAVVSDHYGIFVRY